MARENNKICRVFKALAEPKRYPYCDDAGEWQNVRE